jgi:hypothetical protein
MKRATLVLAALALVLGGVEQARAAFITYRLTTTASGTINGTTETNAPLTVTVTYDTSKVQGGLSSAKKRWSTSLSVSRSGGLPTPSRLSPRLSLMA